jgi:hypothetical protein
MQRKDIIAAAAHISRVFSEAKMTEVVRRGDAAKASELYVVAMKQIFTEFANPTPAELDVLEKLEIKEVLDPAWWTHRLTTPESMPPLPFFFAAEMLPRFVSMLEREGDTASSVLEREGELASLRVILPASEKQHIELSSFLKALKAIEDIYDAAARLQYQSFPPLQILSLDSGSSVAAVIGGAAKSMLWVKGLLVNCMSKIILYDEQQKRAQLENIKAALPLISAVHEMEKEGHLSKDQVEEFTSTIAQKVGVFFKNGATIPEITIVEQEEVPKLFHSARPLLTHGKDAGASSEAIKKKKPRKKKRRELGGENPAS